MQVVSTRKPQEKYGIVPASRIIGECVVNVDKTKLEAAPGLDKDATQPDFADRT